MTGSKFFAVTAPILVGAAAFCRPGSFPSAETIIPALALAFLPAALTDSSKTILPIIMLLPAAATLIFTDGITRAMLTVPLLVIPSWIVSVRIFSDDDPGMKPDRSRASTLAAALGLAVFLFSVPLASPITHLVFFRLGSAVLLPLIASPFGPAAVLLSITIPVLSSPAIILSLAVIGLLLRISPRISSGFSVKSNTLLAILLGCTATLLCLAPWGMPEIGLLFPESSRIGLLGLLIVSTIGFLFPPAPAGALGLFACLLLGPALPVIDSRQGPTRLTTDVKEINLGKARSDLWGLELSLSHGGRVQQDAAAASMKTGLGPCVLRAGRETAEFASLMKGITPAHGLPEHPILRPPKNPGSAWKIAGRVIVPVRPGKDIHLSRDGRIPHRTVLNLIKAGEVSRGPRGEPASETFLWAAAGLVAVLQLFSGLWRDQDGWIPWSFLTAGLIFNRIAVQPLHSMSPQIGTLLAGASLVAVSVCWFLARNRKRSPHAVLGHALGSKT